MVMTYGSLFSGVGGIDLAFDRAGMKGKFQVEIDDRCQRVLAKHWPYTERHGDIKTVGRHNLQAVDVLAGGFPCQDLSIAGRRQGLSGERSGLWFEFRRVVEELAPAWVVIENVPGLLSSHKGQDFAVLLQGLVELRYGVCWRVLDAQYFGVPQRRRRLFLVAHLGDGRAAEVLFERESRAGDTAPSKGEGEAHPHALTIGALDSRHAGGFQSAQSAAAGHLIPDVSMSVNSKWAKRSGGPSGNEHHNLVCWEMSHASEAVRESGDIAPTLQSRMGTGGNQVPLVGVRRFTPTECERLMGLPVGWTEGHRQSDSTRYRQIGNSVAVPCVEWIARRIVAVHERSINASQ